MIKHWRRILCHALLPRPPPNTPLHLLRPTAPPHRHGHLNVLGRRLPSLLKVALNQCHVHLIAADAGSDHVGKAHFFGLRDGGEQSIVLCDRRDVAVKCLQGDHQSLRGGDRGVDAGLVGRDRGGERRKVLLVVGDKDGHGVLAVGVAGAAVLEHLADVHGGAAKGAAEELRRFFLVGSARAHAAVAENAADEKDLVAQVAAAELGEERLQLADALLVDRHAVLGEDDAVVFGEVLFFGGRVEGEKELRVLAGAADRRDADLKVEVEMMERVDHRVGLNAGGGCGHHRERAFVLIKLGGLLGVAAVELGDRVAAIKSDAIIAARNDLEAEKTLAGIEMVHNVAAAARVVKEGEVGGGELASEAQQLDDDALGLAVLVIRLRPERHRHRHRVRKGKKNNWKKCAYMSASRRQPVQSRSTSSTSSKRSWSGVCAASGSLS